MDMRPAPMARFAYDPVQALEHDAEGGRLWIAVGTGDDEQITLAGHGGSIAAGGCQGAATGTGLGVAVRTIQPRARACSSVGRAKDF